MSLKQIAREVLAIVDQGYYEVNDKRISIEGACQISFDDGKLYTADEVQSLRENRSDDNLESQSPPTIEVVDATTQQAAHQLTQHAPLMLLNFASARSAGGGFLNGAKAQEEDLCRCSALFPAIERHREYYDVNRACDSLLYTDYLIYNPNVPFFKTRGTGELLDRPFFASVITAPAPNTRPYLKANGDPQLLKECFARRWRNVLAVAKEHGDKTILLGAWGCGAFGGDPEMASATARNAIDEWGHAFDKIVFAIPGKGKQSRHNLETFSKQFDVDIGRL